MTNKKDHFNLLNDAKFVRAPESPLISPTKESSMSAIIIDDNSLYKSEKKLLNEVNSKTSGLGQLSNISHSLTTPLKMVQETSSKSDAQGVGLTIVQEPSDQGVYNSLNSLEGKRARIQNLIESEDRSARLQGIIDGEFMEPRDSLKVHESTGLPNPKQYYFQTPNRFKESNPLDTPKQEYETDNQFMIENSSSFIKIEEISANIEPLRSEKFSKSESNKSSKSQPSNPSQTTTPPITRIGAKRLSEKKYQMMNEKPDDQTHPDECGTQENLYFRPKRFQQVSDRFNEQLLNEIPGGDQDRNKIESLESESPGISIDFQIKPARPKEGDSYIISAIHSEQVMSPVDPKLMKDEEQEEEEEQTSGEIIIEEIKKEFRSVNSIAQRGESNPQIKVSRRYDKEFFEKLKNQSLGFSTLLKSRQSSPLNLGRESSSKSEHFGTIDLKSGLQRLKESPRRSFHNNPFSIKETEEFEKEVMDSSFTIQGGDTKGRGYIEDLVKQIERNNIFKSIIEEAIILFKEKPEKAFDYLVSKNCLEPGNLEQRVQFLLCTPGLSKEKVGLFLGKNSEETQKILKIFCMKIDFRKMRMDEALRLFLSRFLLPGEGQQIERIIEAFSYQYYLDNEELFSKPDVAYFLAFTLIMVNTSSHNKNNKRKLSVQEFLKMNLEAFQKISEEELVRMYDSIVANQFKTKPEYLEKIYGRIAQIKQAKKKMQGGVIQMVQKGDYFLKFCRNGKQKMRYLLMKNRKLCWKSKQDTSQCRFINLKDIIDIRVGANTTSNIRKHKIPLELDELCFSIVTKYRSLDLQAKNATIRSYWVSYFYDETKEHRIDVSNNTLSRKLEERMQRRDHLIQIWETDIMPHLTDYWDFMNHCPKRLEVSPRKAATQRKHPQQGQRKQNKFCGLGSCFGQRRSKNNYESFQGAAGSRQKVNIMDCLWRQGIPEKFRKKLWPFAIRNQLQISKELYQILYERAKRYLRNQAVIKEGGKEEEDEKETVGSHEFSKENATIQEWIYQIKEDAETTLIHFSSGGSYGYQVDHSILEKNLLSFAIHRPDIGYRRGMSFMMAMILTYCSPFDAFVTFTNFVHSNHFLPFFKGIESEIKIRIIYFNDKFRQRMPDLESYFRALDITPDLFLIDWLMTLFVKNMDFELCSRIWDNFILDKEIYAMRVGLAILKLFESRFLKSSQSQIIGTLLDLNGKLEEERFFEYIEACHIDKEEYHRTINELRWAKEKSKVLQSVFSIKN